MNLTLDDFAHVFAPYGESPCGPCAFCGHPDKRHRMWDTIADRIAAGESVDELAADYGYPRAVIERYLVLSAKAAADD